MAQGTRQTGPIPAGQVGLIGEDWRALTKRAAILPLNDLTLVLETGPPRHCLRLVQDLKRYFWFSPVERAELDAAETALKTTARNGGAALETATAGPGSRPSSASSGAVDTWCGGRRPIAWGSRLPWRGRVLSRSSW